MDLDLAIFQLAPTSAYRLNDTRSAILEWRGPGVQPTTQQLTDAWTAYQAAQTTKTNDAATQRSAVAAQLQALVGLQWTALTAAQRQMVIVGLLYRAGALDKTLTIQPLAGWL